MCKDRHLCHRFQRSRVFFIAWGLKHLDSRQLQKPSHLQRHKTWQIKIEASTWHKGNKEKCALIHRSAASNSDSLKCQSTGLSFFFFCTPERSLAICSADHDDHVFQILKRCVLRRASISKNNSRIPLLCLTNAFTCSDAKSPILDNASSSSVCVNQSRRRAMPSLSVRKKGGEARRKFETSCNELSYYSTHSQNFRSSMFT